MKTFTRWSILALIIMGFGSQAFAQRYLTEVFTSVKVTKNVVYDSNISVNIIPPNNPPLVPTAILCDVYEPDGDTETERPLVIIYHTGSYLPPIVNQQTTGNKEDSTIVEMCRRFARRGFVAVGANNRIGWNPLTQNPDSATAQLLQATFRGIQDAKNAIRYFRVNASTFGVDTGRIIIGGQGTGGYIALAAATVDKRSEVELLKFRFADLTPMVNIDLFGDWNGIGGIPQLNMSGDPNVSTKFHFSFNYGGAIGDTSWIDGGEVPHVAIQTVLDPFAPYNVGNVVVPTTGVTVINNAGGAGAVIPVFNALGNNDTLVNRDYTDPFTARANAINGGNEGLFPLQLPPRTPAAINQGSPWEWWDSNVVKQINFPAPGAGAQAHANSMLTNPDMSKQKAMAYIDTIQGYLVPRIVCALGLPGCPPKKSSSVRTFANRLEFSAYPNPASEWTALYAAGRQIESLEIMDISGAVIYTSEKITDANPAIYLGSLKPGVYFIRAFASDATGVTRIIKQ